MIQRQQTLWLLFSTVSAIFTFQLPFYTGQLKDGKYSELDGGNNFFILVLTGLVVLLAAITIFMYKDRKVQFRLTLVGAAVSLAVLVIYFAQIKKFQSGSISLYCLFEFAMVIGFVMAARGIRKDEKTVKNLDKLR